MGRSRSLQRGDNSTILRKIDWIAFSLCLALTVVGLLMIFSVGYEEFRVMGWGDFFSTSAGKQTIWIGICGLVFAAIMLFDSNFWQTFAYPIYIISMALLFFVLFLGTTIKGATSWYSFGGFSLQPSEIAKFGTCLAVAAFLSNYSTDLRNLRSQMTVAGLLLLPIILILAQPDAGSALVFTSFLVVLYRAGLSPNIYIVGFFLVALLIAGLVFAPIIITICLILLALFFLAYNIKSRNRLYWLGGVIAIGAGAYYFYQLDYTEYVLGGIGLLFLAMSIFQWQQRNARLVYLSLFFLIIGSGIAYAASYAFNNVLKPHQQDRINVWLQPSKCDQRGSLYNLEQSKTAIGSGGLQGKGFLEGTMTKLNYVPEQSTDFIFCTIGEEQGFIGSFGIISLFFLLLLRITIIAERQRTDFARYYAYSVVGILFIHFFVNIGMTMGLTPIIGIPLPFISKGGSSLLGFTIMIAVLLRLDKHRSRA
ncbi:MAG: rod shape-determining protein RodA [Chitinophagales bacterium]|nr:rod shape-determining protein RodA [Chitinophagales bacterium]